MNDDFDLGEWLSEETTPTPVGPTEPSKPALTKLEVSILSYTEQVFWETGSLPTPEAVANELPCRVVSVREAFKNEAFQLQLASRGIDPSNLVVPGKALTLSKALSPQQIVCANVMLNLHDKRSQREKLAFLNISSQQFHAWLRNPTFQQYMNKRAEQLLSSSDWQAYRSLISNVTAGDYKSLELFFRMRGIYTPNVTVNFNIEVILQKTVEVIARYVKDPATIQAIAAELENIVDAEEVA